VEPGLIWLLAGLLLIGAELALPGILLLWIGLAATATGAVALLVGPLSTVESLVVFGVALGLSLFLAHRAGGAWPRSEVNTPESGLVGRRGTLLVEPPGAPGGTLRVRVGDGEWPARLPRDLRLPDAGAVVPVRVEGVDGTTLLVRPE
jgi:hypothetical protein